MKVWFEVLYKMALYGYKLKFATMKTKALKLSVLHLASKFFYNFIPPFLPNWIFIFAMDLISAVVQVLPECHFYHI